MPETGEWMVISDGWRIEAREIVKVTSKLVFWKIEHCRNPFRVRADDIDFCGPKEAAQKLAAQLQSSRAQELEENRRSAQRREERDRKFVEQAKDRPAV